MESNNRIPRGDSLLLTLLRSSSCLFTTLHFPPMVPIAIIFPVTDRSGDCRGTPVPSISTDYFFADFLSPEHRAVMPRLTQLTPGRPIGGACSGNVRVGTGSEPGLISQTTFMEPCDPEDWDNRPDSAPPPNLRFSVCTVKWRFSFCQKTVGGGGR